MRIKLFSAALLASGISCAATAVDGFYSAAFGGYSYLPNNIFTSRYDQFFNNVQYHDGYNVGGRFGFQSNPMRYEVEYTYVQASPQNFDVNGIEQTFVSGDSSANLLMANAYYDFPSLLPAISPFLGFGIGYAYLQTHLNSEGPLTYNFLNSNDSVFAYQGSAGLTYNFSENYAINVAYRYIATSKAGDYGSNFQAHLASAAAIYRFDQGNYK